MDDLEEFAMMMDVVSRMAVVALAKALNPDDLEVLFEGVKVQLGEAYGDGKKEKLDSIVDRYKQGTIMVSRDLANT